MGAGYSTLFARIVMMIVMMVYVHRSPKLKIYMAQPWIHSLDHQLLRTMMRLGLPNGLIYLFEVGAFSGAAIIMGWFGAVPLAAHQITISIASMTFLVAVGIGIAASIRVGYETGRGDKKAARYAGFTAIALSVGYMSCCALGFLVLRKWLPTNYVTDPDVIALAATLFIVVAVFQIFDGIQAVAMGALRGLQDTAWPSTIAFISYWLVGLPCGYLLAFKMGVGPLGIWLGLLIGLTTAAILFTWRFNRISGR
jgi:MATE family multidrug resistance protein